MNAVKKVSALVVAMVLLVSSFGVGSASANVVNGYYINNITRSYLIQNNIPIPSYAKKNARWKPVCMYSMSVYMGDADGNGVLTANDINVLKYVVKQKNSPSVRNYNVWVDGRMNPLRACDVNNNGRLDDDDVIKIRNYYYGARTIVGRAGQCMMFNFVDWANTKTAAASTEVSTRSICGEIRCEYYIKGSAVSCFEYLEYIDW